MLEARKQKLQPPFFYDIRRALRDIVADTDLIANFRSTFELRQSKRTLLQNNVEVNPTTLAHEWTLAMLWARTPPPNLNGQVVEFPHVEVDQNFQENLYLAIVSFFRDPRHRDWLKDECNPDKFYEDETYRPSPEEIKTFTRRAFQGYRHRTEEDIALTNAPIHKFFTEEERKKEEIKHGEFLKRIEEEERLIEAYLKRRGL